MADTEAAVIGAGPYGLSIAAHLNSRRIACRILGPAMESWRGMPRGMLLKSEGCASSLADPQYRYTLERYCAERGLPFRRWGLPVPLDLFVEYGLWFQERAVPQLDPRRVKSLTRTPRGFRIALEDSEGLEARKVIVATGISGARRLAGELAHLPPHLISHSSDHRDLGVFRGRKVVVLGAGQSAIESAALLHEGGAEVQLVARRRRLSWNGDANAPRSAYQRVRQPMTVLGPGLRNVLYVHGPQIFRLLPEAVRIQEVKTALGPAGAWWLKSRFDGRVPALTGLTLRSAEALADRVSLWLEDERNDRLSIVADHLIAATGYQITKASFPWMTAVLGDLAWGTHGPTLSRHFESSVRGLYFTGLAAAFTFGPSMRFVAGAHHASRMIAAHIARKVAREPVERSTEIEDAGLRQRSPTRS
jgi:cation diffusion facilitator CzcD-associated flavoprotein CzcO